MVCLCGLMVYSWYRMLCRWPWQQSWVIWPCLWASALNAASLQAVLECKLSELAWSLMQRVVLLWCLFCWGVCASSLCLRPDLQAEVHPSVQAVMITKKGGKICKRNVMTSSDGIQLPSLQMLQSIGFCCIEPTNLLWQEARLWNLLEDIKNLTPGEHDWATRWGMSAFLDSGLERVTCSFFQKWIQQYSGWWHPSQLRCSDGVRRSECLKKFCVIFQGSKVYIVWHIWHE